MLHQAEWPPAEGLWGDKNQVAVADLVPLETDIGCMISGLKSGLDFVAWCTKCAV